MNPFKTDRCQSSASSSLQDDRGFKLKKCSKKLWNFTLNSRFLPQDSLCFGQVNSRILHWILRYLNKVYSLFSFHCKLETIHHSLLTRSPRFKVLLIGAAEQADPFEVTLHRRPPSSIHQRSCIVQPKTNGRKKGTERDDQTNRH